MAMSEARAREELSEVHRRLVAAQALIHENATHAERARILGDLHDVLGHHLAALSLSLETAGNLTEGRAQELVKRAGGLSRLMLADVRAVVHETAAEAPVELGPAIRRLAEPLTSIGVGVTVDQSLPRLDGAVSLTLLRCVQEFLTNTVRHSGATSAQIHVRGENGGVALVARDNGRGSDHMAPGAGLTGMRTRVEGAGGMLRIRTLSGQGFEVRAWLPMQTVGA
jgi:signal transduction histidine kinase